MSTNNSTATRKRLRVVPDDASVLLWMTDLTGGRDSVDTGWAPVAGGPAAEELGEGWMLDRGTARSDANESLAGFIGSCIDLRERRGTDRESDRELQDERRSHLAAEESLHETMVREPLVASGVDAIVIAMAGHVGGGHQDGVRVLDDRHTVAGQFPAILGDVEADDRPALASLPLAAGHDVLGALELSFDEPQDFPDDLRHFLLSIAAESAAGLVRVLAGETEPRTHRRLELLLEVTRQMADPRTPADVLARACGLAVGRLADLVIRPDLAMVGAATDAHSGRMQGGQAIPRLVQGATRAVLVLSSTGSDDRHHDQDELISASLLTRVLPALSVAHRAGRERATVAVLQTAVMPSGVPSVVGRDIAARDLPAGRDTSVSGDRYDVIALADGQVSIAIGDVSGHGLPAATVMVEARNPMRASDAEHLDPAEALARKNTCLHESRTLARSAFVTAVLAVLDAGTGEVRWSSAGHPSPMIRSVDATEVQHGGGGTLLRPFADTHDETKATRLAAGDVSVLDTDGLIERRRP